MATNAYKETLERLLVDLEAINVKREKLLAAITAVRELLGEPNSNGNKPSQNKSHAGRSAPKRKRPARKRLTGVTAIGMAADVIREAGEPLHISEIQRRMTMRGFRQEPKVFRYSLARTMDRKAGEGKVFLKTGPATYGLIEFQGQGGLFEVEE